MALIKCPECGEKMSDSATKCPHCGKVNSKRTKGCGTALIIVLVGLFLVANIFLVLHYFLKRFGFDE